jgi:hypothetical protein
MPLFLVADLAAYLSIGIAALAVVGSVVTAMLTLRFQRGVEKNRNLIEEHRSFEERYMSATEQLGHAQAAVRLSGVHALVRLTDDWKPQRQAGIDVLCAYLRMPYDPEDAPNGERRSVKQSSG